VIEQAMEMAQETMHQPDMLHSDMALCLGEAPLCALFAEVEGDLVTAICQLAEDAQRCVAKDATMVRKRLPAKIFGDTHGQFRDVLLFLEHYGWPEEAGPTFVFNGDFVDRGKHQLETVCLLFALKLAYPSKVVLVRGNHEDEPQSNHMGEAGFEFECMSKLGEDFGQHVSRDVFRAFEMLPLACLLGSEILVVHGGIGDGEWTLDYLENVKRPLRHEDLDQDNVVYNVLWSDPMDHMETCCGNSFGVHTSPRDAHKNRVKTFGPDITKQFCARNKLSMIVRSHQAIKGGFGYDVMHEGKLIRVFSARDYSEHRNDGSILVIGKVPGKKELLVRPQQLLSLTKPTHSRKSAVGMLAQHPEMKVNALSPGTATEHPAHVPAEQLVHESSEEEDG